MVNVNLVLWKHVLTRCSIKVDFVLVFCVNFETSTKTNLEVKFDLPASYWTDSLRGSKQERGIMHSVYPAVRQPGISGVASPTIWSCYANLNHYHYSFL